MDLGITGLGRMGAGMAERWLRGGHRVVAHNRNCGPIDELASKGADAAYSVKELVRKLQTPRAVWIMLPAGKVLAAMRAGFGGHAVKKAE
jgi:6-phosphogluconate dehydrogenase